jgi:hypothetical protein
MNSKRDGLAGTREIFFSPAQSRREWLIPFVLGLVNIVLYVPVLGWGTPGYWHPDELIYRIIHAISTQSIPYNPPNHPNLYLYPAYFIGRILHWIWGPAGVMIGLRAMSVCMSSIAVGATYFCAKQTGGSVFSATVASCCLMACNAFANNAFFAHNDMYMLVFMIAGIIASQRYAESGSRRLFYIACACIGCAAGCKYNGALILPVPFILLFLRRPGFAAAVRTALKGGALFTGIVILSIPRVLWRPMHYLTWNFRNFFQGYTSGEDGWGMGNPVGLIGHEAALRDAIGTGFLILFGISTVFWLLLIAYRVFRHRNLSELTSSTAIVLLGLACVDFPLNFSHIYPTRYLLPLLPFFCVLVSASLEYCRKAFIRGPALSFLFAVPVLAIIAWSFLRVAGVVMLFKNDARNAAGRFLSDGLPENATIESVMYPPNFPSVRYQSRNYPFRFRVFHSEIIPDGYNTGCSGLEQRKPDYFILDGFTYTLNCIPEKKSQLNSEDCKCWKNIMDNKTDYSLLRTFSYTLPDYFPEVEADFANPVIWIFKRSPDGK